MFIYEVIFNDNGNEQDSTYQYVSNEGPLLLEIAHKRVPLALCWLSEIYR